MSDLISRAEAIRIAEQGQVQGFEWQFKKLCDLPSVQPQKGEWIDYSSEGFVECPFCHSATNCYGNKDKLHYCFSCGAELR